MSTRRHSTCLVDLGYAVARVTREGYGDHIATRLMVMTPADSGEQSYTPASSTEVYIGRPEQLQALITALTANPPEVEL